MTLLGELSGKFGFYRWESGKANHELVEKDLRNGSKPAFTGLRNI